MKRQSIGFTIVEVLIIVAIIGILTTITSLVYTGIQRQAREAGIKSDFETTTARIDRYRSEKGEYPRAGGSVGDAELLAAGIEVQRSLYSESANNYLYCASVDGQSYALVARGISDIVYAFGTNRPFTQYSAYPLSNSTQVCESLVGANAYIRYGYMSSGGWRSWAP